MQNRYFLYKLQNTNFSGDLNLKLNLVISGPGMLSYLSGLWIPIFIQSYSVLGFPALSGHWISSSIQSYPVLGFSALSGH